METPSKEYETTYSQIQKKLEKRPAQFRSVKYVSQSEVWAELNLHNCVSKENHKPLMHDDIQSPCMTKIKRDVCKSPLSSSESEHEPVKCLQTPFSLAVLDDSDDYLPVKAKVTKKKTKKTKTKSKTIAHKTRRTQNAALKAASKEMLAFLFRQLGENNQADMILKYGFGLGSFVEIPHDCSSAEWATWRALFDSLEFKMSGLYVYNIAYSKADALLGQIRQLLPTNPSPLSPNVRALEKSFDNINLSPITRRDSTEFDSFVPELPLIQNRRTSMDSSATLWHSKRNRNRARRLSRAVSRTSIFESNRLSMAPLSMSIVAENTVAMSLEVATIVLNSMMLPLNALKTDLRNVSRDWRILSDRLSSWVASDYDCKSLHIDASLEAMVAAFPKGRFLSDGAYKEVFQVWSSQQNRMEAISVMNINAIASTGNEGVVRQEVYHSLLLANMSQCCPNFLDIYEAFTFSHAPPAATHWKSLTDEVPKEKPMVEASESGNVYQYIRMELCDGGDLEDFIRDQANQTLPLHEAVVPYLFQMVFAIYAARDKYQLRHFDIKLLNFFLKKVPSEHLDAVYAFGSDCYQIQLDKPYACWVKLADYGTAETQAETLGKPIALEQFTTLENTPIEFFTEGDDALHLYACDTFPLGLCVLHLLTGRAPYEELLEPVQCPPALLKALKAAWKKKPTKSAPHSYSLLTDVLRDDPDDIIPHTFYRYLVLFGLPDEFPKDNTVWQVIQRHLCPSKKSRTRGPSVELYQEHVVEFSFETGSHEALAEARARCLEIPGLKELLLKMVSPDVSLRPTMRELLQSSIFDSIRVTPEEAGVAGPEYKFMEYGRLDIENL